MSGRLVSFFMETDLRQGHDGLAKVAMKKASINTKDLQPGEFVIFVNKAVSAFKMFGHNATIVYHRPKTGRLELKAIQHIPQVFKAGKLRYDEALELAFSGYRRRNITKK